MLLRDNYQSERGMMGKINYPKDFKPFGSNGGELCTEEEINNLVNKSLQGKTTVGTGNIQAEYSGDGVVIVWEWKATYIPK